MRCRRVLFQTFVSFRPSSPLPPPPPPSSPSPSILRPLNTQTKNLHIFSVLPPIRFPFASARRYSDLCDARRQLKNSSRLPFQPPSRCQQIFFFCSSSNPSVQISEAKDENEADAWDLSGSVGRRFAVLLTGHASEYTERKYGGYGKMFARLLADPGEAWDVFPVVDGKFPTDEELAKYEGFVLTGSRHDAHGNESWIQHLCSVLQSLHEKRKKMLGICFGHQVLTRALGGKTGRSAIGWEIGIKDVTFTNRISSKSYGSGLPCMVKVLQSHRDQVLELPPKGELLGSSEKTDIEMFAIGEHVLGIQGHPEFSKEVLLDIIDSRRALGVIKETEANMAKESMLAFEDDKETLQKLCKAFLKRKRVGQSK